MQNDLSSPLTSSDDTRKNAYISECTTSETNEEELNIAPYSKKCFKRLAIPYSDIGVILKTLKPHHCTLPESHENLMCSDNNYEIETSPTNDPGQKSEFVYLGIAENLERIINTKLHHEKKLRLQISFGGVPLFEFSQHIFHPFFVKYMLR
ncbi:hypothetical protein QAD02_020408 [Eretmocerus hayati]|uniref:Uncharacterized protein n=1 Tax=Eretmocerus hayati TaxID=131215 RepID=A0ACC2PS54_9HYME|nr:hypothetical protein QAD02_020408 [Eretmocerus hayati]